MSKFRSFLLPVLLTLVLFAMLALTSPVHAQDEQSPPEQPMETPLVVEESPVSEEAVTPAEPEVTDPLPVEEPSPEETLAETVDALADAGAVLTDENGEVLPLTSEEAVEVLTAEADPYFTCPVLYDTVDGIADGICRYFGATAIQAAVNDFITRHGSGAIRVEAGNYTGNVLVNSVTGLTGILGAGMENNPATSSILTGSIEIAYMTTSFSLTGFYISANQDQAAVYIHESVGTLTLENLNITNIHNDGEGLVVENHTGAVNLYQVNAVYNGSTGAEIATQGNITITNSAFNFNGGASGTTKGLLLQAVNGSVTINGISASNNTRGDGAHIFYTTTFTLKNSIFTDNLGSGVLVQASSPTGGAVLVENVIAADNGGYGINLQATKGAVTMRTLTIDDNHLTGIAVDTCALGGGICTSNGTGNVTIQDAFIINGDAAGLGVLAYGNISLNNVQSYSNTVYGTYLTTQYVPTGSRTISVTNSVFQSTLSAGTGLAVYSTGNVTLNHITSSYNLGSGLIVDSTFGTTAGASLLGTQGANEFQNNSLYGIWIAADGPIVVNNVLVKNSGYSGIFLNNATAASATVGMNTAEITNTGTGAGSYYALQIASHGTITLTKINCHDNVDSGALIQNQLAAGTPGVTISSSTFNHAVAGIGLMIDSKGAVSLTTLEVSNNAAHGVSITTLGNITINSVNASGNTGGAGFYLNNNGGTGSVTFTNPSALYMMIQGNGSDGATILSAGNVSVTGYSFTQNQLYGLFIQNYFGPANTPHSITLNRVAAGYNWNADGIYAYSDGAITFTNVLAYSNPLGDGVETSNLLGTAGITINGFTSYGNGRNGLFARTNGAFSLTNGGSISSNGINGLDLDNHWGTGAVTVSSTSGADASNNAYNGLLIITRGAVTISGYGGSGNYGNPAALDPRGYGLYVDNSTGTGGVTLNNSSWKANVNVFNFNANSGVRINTMGTVALNNFRSASNNGRYGIHIGTSPTAAVTITGSASFFDEVRYNDMDGVNIQCGGNVTISYLEVDYNGDAVVDPSRGYGIYLVNTSGTGSVTIRNSQTSNNLKEGLYLRTNGTISLTSFQANANTFSAANMDNSTASSPRSVTISGSSFNGTTSSTGGLLVYSRGTISMTNSSASSNGSTGANLNNFGAPTPTSITVTNCDFDHNAWNGLIVTSRGAISVRDSGALTNANMGMSLDNHTTTTATITLTNNVIKENSNHGININAGGNVSVTGTTSEHNLAAGYGASIISAAGTVTITNSAFNRNTGTYGLYIVTDNAISLNTVECSSNAAGGGASLVNPSTRPTATISISKGTFNYNLTDGLRVNTLHAVTINGLIANGNALNGVAIATAAGMPINILSSLRPNEFQNNTGRGLSITSGGAVTASKINAYGNVAAGIYLTGLNGTVNLTTISATMTMSGPGVYVDTIGAININGLTANGNGILAAPNDRDGLEFNSHGFNVLVQNSTLTGNGRNGIRATLGGAVLTVKASSFFGNDLAAGVPDPNIYLSGAGTLVVIR